MNQLLLDRFEPKGRTRFEVGFAHGACLLSKGVVKSVNILRIAKELVLRLEWVNVTLTIHTSLESVSLATSDVISLVKGAHLATLHLRECTLVTSVRLGSIDVLCIQIPYT